jgi:hypothetical protein
VHQHVRNTRLLLLDRRCLWSEFFPQLHERRSLARAAAVVGARSVISGAGVRSPREEDDAELLKRLKKKLPVDSPML